jgi:hypothetical protein
MLTSEYYVGKSMGHNVDPQDASRATVVLLTFLSGQPFHIKHRYPHGAIESQRSFTSRSGTMERFKKWVEVFAADRYLCFVPTYEYWSLSLEEILSIAREHDMPGDGVPETIDQLERFQNVDNIAFNWKCWRSADVN